MSDNLIPAKPGEVRNPNGKPKGTRNRSTIAREAIEAILDGETQTVFDKMTAAIIAKAISGDVAAYKELLDSSFGKNKEHTAITNPDGSLTPQAITVKVVTKKD